MAIQSPATVVILLKKAKTTYDKVKPDPKSKAETRHKEIVKDLQRLRTIARMKNGPGAAKLAKPFGARKKILLKKLTEHRKKINSSAEKNNDPNKALLAAYTKSLLKLTRVILAFDFNTVTAEAEEDVGLDGLEEGDAAALDNLDNVSTDELLGLEQSDDIALEEDAEAPETDKEESAPPAPPPAPRPVDGVGLLKKFLALKNDYSTASASQHPEVANLRSLFEQTQGFLTDKKFSEAAQALASFETLLGKIKGGGGKGEDGATPGRAVAGWQIARGNAVSKLRQLESAVAKTKDPLAGDALRMIEAIIKRLTTEIGSRQAAQEMLSFVGSDQSISDLETAVDNVAYNIRAPLVKALQALAGQLPE